MIALSKWTPFLVAVFFWLAVVLLAAAVFGFGGLDAFGRSVSAGLAAAILLILASSPYYMLISRKFIWRSARFGFPLVRRERISEIRLDGRLIESAEVGRLMFVAESGYDLARGGELTERETEFVRNVADSLGATG